MPDSQESTASAVPDFTPARAPIKVYVRLGDHDGERTIAFRIPDSMDPLDLLARGATIDGNQAILPVAWDDNAGAFQSGGAFTCPDLRDPDNWYESRSMARVLGSCQRGLVEFFKERGYTVQLA